MKFSTLNKANTAFYSIFTITHSDIVCGSCSYGNCSCTHFAMSNDPQWCDNCGHARSYHFNG